MLRKGETGAPWPVQMVRKQGQCFLVPGALQPWQAGRVVALGAVWSEVRLRLLCSCLSALLLKLK